MTGVSTCLHHALEIQRKFAPKDWGPEIDRIPEGCRDECREYLRGMYQRAKVARETKAAMKRRVAS